MRASKDRVVQELDRCLTEERAAVVAGRLAALAGLARRKSALLARLSARDCSSDSLLRIRTALVRQDRFLAAARRGTKRLTSTGVPADRLTTYRPNGTTADIAPVEARIARRV